ncbi:MAG: hypothetical protein WBA46_12960, partial [Thermomicrobiales bacterium]
VKHVGMIFVMLMALTPTSGAAWDTTSNPSPEWDCGDYQIRLQYDALERGEYRDQDAGVLVLAFLDSGIGILDWEEVGLKVDGAIASHQFSAIDPDELFEYTIYLAYDRGTIVGADVFGDTTSRSRQSIATAMSETLAAGKPPRVVMDGSRRICETLPDNVQ